MNALRPLALALTLVLAGAAHAAPVYEDRVEDYTVVAGDTISGITKRFLGDETFWEDNWKLNPGVRDPDLLRIGQRLRIITQRKVIAESAQVVEAVNKTEKMVARPRWQPATRGDTLAPGQGLRTREQSTAELRFNAESSLRLGEFSQVFLARKETSLRGVDRGSVSVERGSVDLVFAPMTRPRTQIEIVAGAATTTPKPAAGKPTELRTGADEDGAARVMVYRGESSVAAAGAEVAVRQGMGTKVPQSGPPSTPEKLLPAPVLDPATVRWSYANGILAWRAVEGAAAYIVEVCADAGCTQLQQRQRVDGGVTRRQVAPLPAGAHHWRVLALSASGLEGYTSAAGALQVDDATPDLEGPMLTLRPLSGFVVGSAGDIVLGPEARFDVIAHDERSGVERIELRQGDSDWRAWDGQPLSLGTLTSDGFALRAVDRLGQPSKTLTFETGTGTVISE